MRIGISIALHGQPELAARVMRHYASVSLTGHELVLHAIGSSKQDEAAATAAGWLCDLYPNDNLGAKRNAGLAALRALEVDAVIRIGCDDLLSAPLLERMAGAFAGGADGVTIRGSFAQDAATGEMIDIYRTDYAFGIGRHVLDARGWALYEEDGRVPDRMISAYIAGRKNVVLRADSDTPFLQIKTDQSINSFERLKRFSIWQPADAAAVLAHFAEPEAEPENVPAKPTRKRKAAPAPTDTED